MKKFLKFLIILVTILALLEFYGNKIINLLFDNFQDTLCTSKICIDKPKSWLPIIVKNNNKTYLLNIVDTSFLFNIESKHLKDETDGIILSKNLKKIIIKKLNFEMNVIKKLMTKQVYKNNTYYLMEKDDFAFIAYPKEELFIRMDMLNKEALHEILSSLKKR